MNHFVDHPGEKPLSASTWLTVHRLWAYLLSEALPAEFETTASILLADEADSVGVVGPLRIRRAVEGQFGCYLDPVALGQTVVDESMINSLRLAWQVCLPGLRKEPECDGPALRLSPELPRVSRITGSSAGGLFACGMYAAAHGISLNFHRRLR